MLCWSSAAKVLALQPLVFVDSSFMSRDHLLFDAVVVIDKICPEGCWFASSVRSGQRSWLQVPVTRAMIIVAMHNTEETKEPRLWIADGWTAKVLKNEDDDGWAVAMIKDGEPEPALIGPWTMGRDKKNPKPLDGNAFSTLVKTASEFVRRSEQQLHAELHQSLTVTAPQGRVTVNLDITPDEDNPYATLSAFDEGGDMLAEVKTAASFKLNRLSAERWAANNFEKPK